MNSNPDKFQLRCVSCARLKYLDEYSPSAKYGISRECRSCHAEAARLSYANRKLEKLGRPDAGPLRSDNLEVLLGILRDEAPKPGNPIGFRLVEVASGGQGCLSIGVESFDWESAPHTLTWVRIEYAQEIILFSLDYPLSRVAEALATRGLALTRDRLEVPRSLAPFCALEVPSLRSQKKRAHISVVEHFFVEGASVDKIVELFQFPLVLARFLVVTGNWNAARRARQEELYAEMNQCLTRLDELSALKGSDVEKKGDEI